MSPEKEEEFIDNIDANFPFEDPLACSATIMEASKISPKACFKVIQEICGIEDYKRDTISDMQLVSLVNEMKRKFEHPMKELITDVAIKTINKIDLPLAQTLAGLQEVRKYPGLYPPLWILYFSCYEDGVEELKDEILDEWNAMGE